MPFSDLPAIFKAELFSRTFQESPLNSSTFKPVQTTSVELLSMKIVL